jgi:predicted tellurium resistance membrane protein TerC
MDTAKHLLDYLMELWEWLVAGFGLVIIRMLYGKIVRDYFDRLDRIEERMEALEKEYLPRIDAEKLVQDVRAEHERMFEESEEHHKQQREDFKHLTDRLDDVYEMLVKIVQK